MSGKLKHKNMFWKEKKLSEMNKTEWEQICSGCGKCCLNKFEENGKIVFTNVACRFLDKQTCKCKIYENRFKAALDCRKITYESLFEKPQWLPETCAYMLLLKGKELPEWHHLVSGSEQTVHNQGMSVRDRKTVKEYDVKGDITDYSIDWIDL